MTETQPANTIGGRLVARWRRDAEATALVMPGVRWSYDRLLAEANARARGFAREGLQQGDTIGVLMDDGPEPIVLLLGAMLSGICVVQFTPGLDSEHLAMRWHTLAPQVVFTGGVAGRAFDAILDAVEARLGVAIGRLGLASAEYARFLAAGAEHSAVPLAPSRYPEPDDIALIAFTAGVTGPPKTCRISHRNLICKIDPFARRFDLTPVSRLWIGVAMYQIGFTATLTTALSCGAAVVVTPGLDADDSRAFMSGARITHAYPIYLGNWLPIVNAPAAQASDFPALTHVCVTGPITALKRAQRALPQAAVMNTYGSAEAGGSICMPFAEDPVDVRLIGSGRPFAGHSLRIVDPETGEELLAGAVGEIQVRGPGVPNGPSDDPFGSTFTDDGWLRTNDLGFIGRGGALVFRGRLAEILRIGGELVSAVDIETVLMSHRDVLVAQVVGVPDGQSGTIPVAFVEVRSGTSIETGELLAFCAENLPQNQRPRAIHIIAEWPKSSSKIYKPALVDLHLASVS